MSLRWKLGLPLALLVMLQIITSVTSIITVSRYRDNTLILANNTLPETTLIGQIESIGNHLLYETLAVLYTPEGRLEHQEHRKDIFIRLTSALEQLKAIQALAGESGSDEDRAVEALTRSVAELKQASNNLIQSEPRDTATFQRNLVALENNSETFNQRINELRQLVNTEREEAVALAQVDPVELPRFLGSISLAISILLLVLIIVGVLHPIKQLRQVTEAIAAGDMSQRIALDSRDELGQLASSFNLMLTYIDGQRQTLEQRASDLEQANQTQQQLLATVQALSVPAIPVGEGVLALPLLGTLDQQRSASLSTEILGRISRERTHTVILDVTGLTSADNSTINRLVQIAQSIRLLGARTILTGISPTLAHQLVTLQLDMSTFNVRATLREGLGLALQANGANSLAHST